MSRVPDRYAEAWTAPFDDRIQSVLKPGMRILDVGGGRRPTIPASDRAPGVHYVGLDPDRAELQLAGPGAYDELITGTIEQLDAVDAFDLIVSWQVLEHVGSMEAALQAMRRALRDDGQLVAQFSGRRAAYALINRVTPGFVGRFAMKHLLDRDPQTVFRAHYDQCIHSELDALMTGRWSTYQIVPRYRGGVYFNFSSLLRALYLQYEERIALNRPNLATHYEIYAKR